MPTSLLAHRRNPCLLLRPDGLLRFHLIAFLIIFSSQLQLPRRFRCFGARPSRRVVWQPAHTPVLSASLLAKEPHCSQTCRKCVWNFHGEQLAEYQSMRLSALSTAVAERAGVLCCVLFMAISAQALAQNSATDNPGPAAAQPSVPAQEKPAAATEEKPPAADDKPATVEQKPAPSEEKPAIAQDKPAAVEEKSAATDDKPAIVEQKPAPAEAKPAVAQDKPAAVEEKKSAATADKPAVVEQKPAPPEEKPAVAHQKPALKQKSVARQSKSAARSKAAEHSKSLQPAKLVQPSKPVQPSRAAQKPRERTLVMLCTKFRTYNPSSKTYRGYDGQTHACR